MPPLRKPHRVAFLVPELTVEGADAPNASEAGLLLWISCIEVCQRHPGLAVYDAESTPLVSQDGHFAPHHARPGATPTDSFYGPTRRDELIWLELALPRLGPVRLHALARDGTHQTFDVLGPNLGEQIHHVLERWLAARGLGPPPRRFDAADAADLLAAVHVFAPLLAEQARAYVQLEDLSWMTADAGAADRSTAMRVYSEGEVDDGDDRADDRDAPSGAPAGPARFAQARRLARALASRLTPTLKAPVLRLLALAFREDLTDLILAADPEQPQALFARFLAAAGRGRDHALLRRIIASAPCWALPYAELVAPDGITGGRFEAEAAGPPPPSELETVAGAGIAALCRPGQLDVIETAADRLDDNGRVDEAIRLLERAVALHGTPAAHIALVSLYRESGRQGAWLAQAQRSGALHGCPMDPQLPWYPDQIQIDLLVADALLSVGRLDEAIALRANRLEGREASWPRHTRILTNWRKDPRFVARCYAREGALRGDPARAVEGYGRVEPDDAVDVATFLEALVAMGREDEVALAWSQFGLGKQAIQPVARLAAARCLLAAGEWRRGIEELWRVELTEPGRDDQVAIAHAGRVLASAPFEALEAALGERVAIGAHTLARRMARDVADFAPDAARSSIVLRALGKSTQLDVDPAWLAGFPADTRSRKAIDALFAAAPDGSPLARADRLVDRWLEVAFTEASEDDPAALAQAAAYAAAQALARYLAATTAPPGPLAGGYRTVAAEALALVWRHRGALGDREAQAVLAVLEPLLRRVDRWVGGLWLGVVERSCAIDERANGDIAGFTRELATVSARILGPEETAVLSASVARLHRERPDGWASAVAAQADRLATHTGYAGVDEWADAVAAQHAARELETDDALDALHTACYLAEGKSARPCVHAARTLIAIGRAPAAFAVLCSGLGAGDDAWRTEQLAALAGPWAQGKLDIPLALDQVASQMFAALQGGEPARAERLGRFAVAIDPRNGEAHRNLGIALAQQGKIPDALHHLMRATPEQASQILCGLLYQTGKLADAMTVLDYASRWYVRADQWLTYGGIAYAAMDNPRTIKAYGLAYQLDPDAYDATQLNAYAAVLDEVGDYKTCEAIAKHLLRVAGTDLLWKTCAWSHLACAYAGQGRHDEALELARRAVDRNPLPENAGGFAATLDRVISRSQPAPPPLTPPGTPRAPVFALLEAGDFAAASTLIGDPSWRVRRAALAATRFRFASENDVDVTPRARAAAAAMLAATDGQTELDATLARDQALTIRAQAYVTRDPVPRLGDRMTRDAFYQEFRARGGVVLGEGPPTRPTFVDRVVVPDGRIASISDYVALLRDLAALTPREALAQFDLDDAAYLEVAHAWAAALDTDPTLAAAIAAGLAKR